MTGNPVEHPASSEESARADLYALLALLFHEPPQQALLDRIASAPADGDGVLERAWSALAQAAAGTTAEAGRAEFESLFLGVGKPEVMPYGSYHLSGFLMEKPLAALRGDLAKLGLERGDELVESEDHIAALCEAMRSLIVSDEPRHRELATQAAFFDAHIGSWAGKFLDALVSHPGAGFYAAVANLALVFFEVERQAFEMA